MLGRLPLLAALIVLPVDISKIAAGQPAATLTDTYGDPLPAGAIARFGTVRWRTGADCAALAYMPDGKSLLSVDGDNGCCVWDVATGQKLRQFGAFKHADFPWQSRQPAAISPDKRLVAMYRWQRYTDNRLEHSLEIWDVLAGKQLWQQFDSSARSVVAIAFSPDSNSIATRRYQSAAVNVCDARSGNQQRYLQAPDLYVPNRGGIVTYAPHTLEFSPDGKYLACAAEGAGLSVYALATGKPLVAAALKASNVADWPAFSPDSKLLAWRESQGVYLMHGDMKSRLLIPSTNNGRMGCLTFSPGGKSLVCIGCDGRLQCWDVATGAETLEPPPAPLASDSEGWMVTAFSPDGKTLAVACGPAIHFYDLQSGKKTTAGQGHSSGIHRAELSTDGKTLVSCGQDNSLCIWDTATCKLLNQTSLPSGRCKLSNPLFLPGGKAFAISDQKGLITLFDTASGTILRTFKTPPPGVNLHESTIADACVGPIGQLAPPSSLANFASLFETLAYAVPEQTDELVQFSADGKTLLTRQAHVFGYFEVVRMDRVFYAWWDVATGQQARRYQPPDKISQWDGNCANLGAAVVTVAHEGGAQVIAMWKPGRPKPLWRVKMPGWRDPVLDPLGKNLAFCWGPIFEEEGLQPGGPIRIVEALTGQERFQFSGPPNRSLYGLQFSPDGQTIATRCHDGILRLWDIGGRREICQWQVPLGTHFCFFSPDGKRIFTGGDDTTLLLWDIATLTKSNPPHPRTSSTAADLDKAWIDLGASNAGIAFEAVLALTAAPERALPLIAKRLRPIPDVDPKELQRWLDDLDNAEYAVRQRATKALEDLGDIVEPALQTALKANITLEKRRRIELLLQKTDQNPLSTDELRGLRALEVLEINGTREALRIAEMPIAGASASRMTQEAAAAVGRMTARLAASR